ncbi:protein NinF [Pantoea agglomerans]|uniref:protein NinF n=1 Tax=Enterobacter agglomerans TaxID=549 RepID=UPI003D17F22E
MNEITQSNPPTGDGVQSASACVGCEARLSTQETYACDTCAAGWMKDANFNMCGGEDNG